MQYLVELIETQFIIHHNDEGIVKGVLHFNYYITCEFLQSHLNVIK
jgi:hypothetical protein